MTDILDRPLARTLIRTWLFALLVAPTACDRQPEGGQTAAASPAGQKRAAPVFVVPSWDQSPAQIEARYARAEKLKPLKAQLELTRRRPGTTFLRFLLLVDEHNCPVTFRFRDSKLVQAIVDFRPACAQHGADALGQKMEALLHNRYGSPTAIHEGRMRLAWQTADTEVSLNRLSDPRTKGPGKPFVLWYMSLAELGAEWARRPAPSGPADAGGGD